MNSRFSALFPVLAVAALCIAILSCNWEEKENIKTIREQYYAIDPQTLLETISNGSNTAFIPLDEEPKSVSPSHQIPADWSQDDYFDIIRAVFKFVWQDSPDSWVLNNMEYNLDCLNVGIGFQNGDFRFFRNVIHDGESRMMRFINIDTRNQYIYIWEAEYYPKLVEWEPINLEGISVFADSALQVAEKNGGSNARNSYGNLCDISMWLAPDSGERGWKILYSQNDKQIFSINVDSATGKFMIP